MAGTPVNRCTPWRCSKNIAPTKDYPDTKPNKDITGKVQTNIPQGCRRDFFRGLGVGTLSFPCRGTGSIPDWGTKILWQKKKKGENIDTKLINKILANRIQESIKKEPVRFILGMQDWFNIWKSIRVVHYTNKGQKPHDHLNKQKNVQGTRNRRTGLNLMKTICENPRAPVFSGERLKASPSWQEHKDVHSCPLFSTSYWRI